MTPVEKFTEDILGMDIWVFVKMGFLLGMGVYLFFAIVVVKQVSLMIKTLNGFLLETPIRMFALLHLLLAMLVFGMALMVL